MESNVISWNPSFLNLKLGGEVNNMIVLEINYMCTWSTLKGHNNWEPPTMT